MSAIKIAETSTVHMMGEWYIRILKIEWTDGEHATYVADDKTKKWHRATGYDLKNALPKTLEPVFVANLIVPVAWQKWG